MNKFQYSIIQKYLKNIVKFIIKFVKEVSIFEIFIYLKEFFDIEIFKEK
mgnify:CR=1 FL=1